MGGRVSTASGVPLEDNIFKTTAMKHAKENDRANYFLGRQSDFESGPFLLQEDAHVFAPLASIYPSVRIAGTKF